MRKFYDTVLFDLDGTLTDPKIGITKSFQLALRAFQIDEPDLDCLCKVIGPPLEESFQKFYGFSLENAKKAVLEYRKYYQAAGIYECSLYPGIEDLLKALKESGRQLAVATSKPEIFAKQILEHYQLTSYFSFIGGSELDGRRTDKSEVISYVLKNVPPIRRAIMVGDRIHDIIGAKNNHLDSIGVLFGYGEPAEFHDATYTAKSVEEILELV